MTRKTHAQTINRTCNNHKMIHNHNNINKYSLVISIWRWTNTWRIGRHLSPKRTKRMIATNHFHQYFMLTRLMITDYDYVGENVFACVFVQWMLYQPESAYSVGAKLTPPPYSIMCRISATKFVKYSSCPILPDHWWDAVSQSYML